jgi:hypothetical protein
LPLWILPFLTTFFEVQLGQQTGVGGMDSLKGSTLALTHPYLFRTTNRLCLVQVL